MTGQCERAVKTVAAVVIDAARESDSEDRATTRAVVSEPPGFGRGSGD